MTGSRLLIVKRTLRNRLEGCLGSRVSSLPLIGARLGITGISGTIKRGVIEADGY